MDTKKAKILQQYIEDPELASIQANFDTQEQLADFTGKVGMLKGEKGDKGDDGYTPIKGEDYFDGEAGPIGPAGVDGQDGMDSDPKEVAKLVLAKMPKPKDGKDGKDGQDGAQGPRGEKGEQGDKGEAGEIPSTDHIFDELLKLPVQKRYQLMPPITVENNPLDGSQQWHGSAVTKIVAGTNITISNTGDVAGLGEVTINATGSGSSGYSVSSIISGTTNLIDTVGERLVLADATAGNININLPTVLGNNATIIIKRTDNSVNTVTVTPNATDRIDGNANEIITQQWTSITLLNNGVDGWFIN